MIFRRVAGNMRLRFIHLVRLSSGLNFNLSGGVKVIFCRVEKVISA